MTADCRNRGGRNTKLHFGFRVRWLFKSGSGKGACGRLLLAVAIVTGGLIGSTEPPRAQTGLPADPGAYAAMSSHELAAAVQRMLTDLGYDPGPVDGMPGKRTRDAVLAYQRRNGLPADGLSSPSLAAHLAAAGTPTPPAKRPREASPAEQIPARTWRETNVYPEPTAGLRTSARLPAASEVMVTSYRGRWASIVTADGTPGWVRAFDVRLVNAPAAAARTRPSPPGRTDRPSHVSSGMPREMRPRERNAHVTGTPTTTKHRKRI